MSYLKNELYHFIFFLLVFAGFMALCVHCYGYHHEQTAYSKQDVRAMDKLVSKSLRNSVMSIQAANTIKLMYGDAR